MINLFNIPNHIIDTSKLGHLLHGEAVEKFETAFAEYVGASHACFANSASSLMYIALRSLNTTIRLPSIMPRVVPNVIINTKNRLEFYDDIDSINWYISDLNNRYYHISNQECSQDHPTIQNYNFGFCLSEKIMLYKHLVAIMGSQDINDSIPSERWYEDKWLNWKPETTDLEISERFKHYIKKIEQFDPPSNILEYMNGFENKGI